ncbi:hypothetical protein DENSPDRAFT_843860 [Dentipellis sp. KUC8613]|nr:hypothetical protein DENSPDRAFT_843860 [Dentipellis sp. KUC8613]
MAVRVTFDPDSRIPEPLREMFISWHRSKPASQFRQYGALDKYLNLKFPLDLVKPQNEIRSLVSDIHLFEDATTHAEAQTIADEWEMGNISISSFGTVFCFLSEEVVR